MMDKPAGDDYEKFKEIMERFLDYYGVIPDKGYPTYQNPSLVRFLKNYER